MYAYLKFSHRFTSAITFGCVHLGLAPLLVSIVEGEVRRYCPGNMWSSPCNILNVYQAGSYDSNSLFVRRHQQLLSNFCGQ
jgi:hypothetical protein